MPEMPNPTPRRQSCDRCHGQKLRCTRTSDSQTGVCDRCLRQGAQCVYSSSLPKGRPSVYRTARAPSNPPEMPTMPATPELPCQYVAGHHPETTEANANNNTSGTAGGSSNMNADVNININGNINPDAEMSDDALLAGAMEAWNDMQVGKDPGSNHSNFHTALGYPQTDVSAAAAFDDALPGLLNGQADGNSAGGVPLAALTRLYERGPGLGNDCFDSMMVSAGKNGPDVGIAQLSQLSTRLYMLDRSSRALAGLPCPSRDGTSSPLVDDAAFRSVVTWLLQVSASMNSHFRTEHQKTALETTTTGDILHDAFSASHHLLEILRCLHVDVDLASISTSTSTSTSSSSSASSSVGGGGGGGGGGCLNSWACITQQMLSSRLNENQSGFEQSKPSPTYHPSGQQHSNTVVRHLVIACHTLLLNTYTAVLIALQYDVDLRGSCFPADDSAGGESLADIRLVLVVQLCSYLIKRQHQAVNLYLSSQSPPSSSSSSQQRIRGFGYFQTTPSGSTTSDDDPEMMSDLEAEVQQRFARLRQALRI